MRDRFQTLPVTAIYMVITIDGRILYGVSAQFISWQTVGGLLSKQKSITAVLVFRRYGRIDIKFCTANVFTFCCLHDL